MEYQSSAKISRIPQKQKNKKSIRAAAKQKGTDQIIEIPRYIWNPFCKFWSTWFPRKGSWVLIKNVHNPNLTVHTSNRSQVFNTLRRLHHFGCMHQLLPNISSICNKYQSYGQYGCPQHFKIAKCLFVTNNQTIIRFSHSSCCSIAFKAFLQVFVGHNC